MTIYPSPDSLHGRLVAEAKAVSGLVIERSNTGHSGWVAVRRQADDMIVYHGHRDLSPFKFAADPRGLMTKRASD